MKRSAHADGTYSIRAVDRVCDILDLLQASPDATSLAGVADVTKLPKSSVYRYLSSLEARRYVQRNPLSGDYRLGVALLPLQTHRLEILRRQAIAHLEQLRDQFGETINLGLLDSGRIFYLEIVESQRGVRLAARPGDRAPIHSSALGKAIAAALPADQVRAILAAEGMPRMTPRTITDVGKYLAELEKVRRQGYALDDRENETDGRCVAVPLGSTVLPAALSLSAPTSRLRQPMIPVIARALWKAASQLTDELAPPNEPDPRPARMRQTTARTSRLATAPSRSRSH